MQYDDHIALVLDATVPGVVAPPGEWVELRERFDGFAAMNSTAADSLTEAVLTGDSAAVATLRPLAMAEAAAAAQPTAMAKVVNTVKAAVGERLQHIYQQHTEDIYSRIADEFDGAAERFVKAAAVVDPEASAETVVSATNKERAAWADQPALAAELDRLLPALVASARLCGMSGHDALLPLPLTVNTEGHHRRVVWTAWDSDGRCGRWSAIVAAGVQLRAARDPQAVQDYRRPKPFIERIETRDGTDWVVWDDPEDEGYVEPEPPFVYRPGTLVMRGR